MGGGGVLGGGGGCVCVCVCMFSRKCLVIMFHVSLFPFWVVVNALHSRRFWVSAYALLHIHTKNYNNNSDIHIVQNLVQ